jgi:hypothetical protein
VIVAKTCRRSDEGREPRPEHLEKGIFPVHKPAREGQLRTRALAVESLFRLSGLTGLDLFGSFGGDGGRICGDRTPNAMQCEGVRSRVVAYYYSSGRCQACANEGLGAWWKGYAVT